MGSTALPLVPLLGALMIAGFAGCGDPGERRTSADGSAESERAPAAAAPEIRTVEVPANPCDWIPADQVAALVGRLEGGPERIRSVEQPLPMEDGNACLYRLEAQPRLGDKGVLVEVSPSAGVLYERALGATQQHFAAVLGEAKAESKPAMPEEGWDFSGPLPMGLVSFVGRVGHVSVSVVSQSPDVPRSSLAALAARIRDRIPDLPFSLPPDPMLEKLTGMSGGRPEAPPSGPDPCALLTRAEAEAVLGELKVEPYRSSGNTPLADPQGDSCTYFTARHRALVLLPNWSGGKTIFGMAKGVGATVATALPEAGPDQESADTLDGPWDEAAGNGTTGDLYFLKGDRMLELSYLTSATGADGAVRLARIAVERL
jgi:hypothetical protein